MNEEIPVQTYQDDMCLANAAHHYEFSHFDKWPTGKILEKIGVSVCTRCGKVVLSDLKRNPN